MQTRKAQHTWIHLEVRCKKKLYTVGKLRPHLSKLGCSLALKNKLRPLVFRWLSPVNLFKFGEFLTHILLNAFITFGYGRRINAYNQRCTDHNWDQYSTHSLGRAEVRRLSTQSSKGESHTDVPNLMNKTTRMSWLTAAHNVTHNT